MTSHQTSSIPLRPDLLAIASLIQPGERILDLGCGEGDLLRYLADTKQTIGRGVELSETSVMACIRNGLSVRQGNLHEGLGDYPDRSFETVILSDTLPYLNTPASILREMLRVGQRAIISFLNCGHWSCRLNLLFTGRAPGTPILVQGWDMAMRARPLTALDFVDFCDLHAIHIAAEIYLPGPPYRSRTAGNLFAKTVIFILDCEGS